MSDPYCSANINVVAGNQVGVELNPGGESGPFVVIRFGFIDMFVDLDAIAVLRSAVERAEALIAAAEKHE